VFVQALQTSIQVPVQADEHAPAQSFEQLPEQEPTQPLQKPSQPPIQKGQHPVACTDFGLIMPRPKKAAAVPASAFFEEPSRNLRRVTFLFSFSMIVSFTLDHEKSI
jgi:hypothetical protein